MHLADCLLIHTQRSLVERLRFAILALFSVEIREAAQQTGELAILWPQYLLPDMKRLLVERLSTAIVPLHVVQFRQTS